MQHGRACNSPRRFSAVYEEGGNGMSVGLLICGMVLFIPVFIVLFKLITAFSRSLGNQPPDPLGVLIAYEMLQVDGEVGGDDSLFF